MAIPIVSELNLPAIYNGSKNSHPLTGIVSELNLPAIYNCQKWATVLLVYCI